MPKVLAMIELFKYVLLPAITFFRLIFPPKLGFGKKSIYGPGVKQFTADSEESLYAALKIEFMI